MCHATLPRGERGGQSVKGETGPTRKTKPLGLVEHGEDFGRSLHPLRGVGGGAPSPTGLRPEIGRAPRGGLRGAAVPR